MLRELRIKNLALINDVAVELDNGMTVFTGETGAGKSILIGAIGLLLGERASSESIRSGAEEAEIDGVFEFCTPPPAVSSILEDAGIELEDGTIIVRRVIARNGRNRLRINQVPVPLTTLKQLGDHLIDLHGQHEHQSLLKPETPREIIDSLEPARSARREYAHAYERYSEAKASLDTLMQRAEELAERREVLEFQFSELSKLKLRAGEEQDLEEQLRRISSVSERTESARAIASELSGDTSEEALGRRVASLRRNLETLVRYDTSAQPWLSDIENVVSFVSELETFITAYLQDIESSTDPSLVDTLNTRLAKIQRLKKKYRCAFDDLLEKQHALKADLDQLENVDADRAHMQKRLDVAKRECATKAGMLAQARAQAAAQLDAAVSKAMGRLGFTGGKWRTAFTPENELTPHGTEELSFEVRTNPGEAFRALSKTASGGEISRLMLAIKTFMADKDRIPIVIFDEIDAGIGGMLAGEVARALKALSATHQLLCISHLHQIASVADFHFSVYKVPEGTRTVTRVKRLSEKEKVEEISRMLGGTSDISRKHAEQLLGHPDTTQH